MTRTCGAALHAFFLQMLTEHMEAQRPRHEQLREQKRLEEELASER